ncbi:hypothetical protein J4457_03970, partial [Candidatus Woesearchaeota archaeon]|nr:hypothetical protein [Candidatus Woesearchaeota archaeon]
MFFRRKKDEPEFSQEDLDYLGRFNRFLSEAEMRQMEELKLQNKIDFGEAKIVMKLHGTKVIPAVRALSSEAEDFAEKCNLRVKKQV